MYLIYLAVLACSFPYLCHRFTSRSDCVLILVWLCLYVSLGTFAYFTDDYGPYTIVVKQAYVDPLSNLAVELFWIWLAGCTQGDIDLYRFLTFTVMAILLLLIHKAACMEMKYLVIYYTFFCMMTHFTGIRQGLNLLLCLYGILLCFNRHWVVGVACVVLSCFLHKSGIMFAFLLPFALLPINRMVVCLYLLVSPVLYVAFYALLNSSDSFLPLLVLQEYAEKEGEFANRHIVLRLLNSISELCLFLLTFLTIVYFRKSTDRLVVLLTRCLFGLFFIAVFLFLLPMDTNVIYKRLLWFGMLIVAVVWGKCIQGNLLQRRYLYLFLLLILCLGLGVAMMLGNRYTEIDKLTRLPFMDNL